MIPLVSILIPAYNAADWIADTIQSALDQTWARKEIIVVDDGSTDNTLAVAQQFISKDVIVLTQKNAGASAARNRAYSVCRGDYIQWLDADDLLAPDKIARQIQALTDTSTPRTLLSSAWGSFAYRTANARFAPTPLWRDLPPTEWMLRTMEQNLYMQTTCWLVSRQLCDAAGPWDTRLSLDDDGEYFFRVIMACDSVRFVPDAKAFYRRLGCGNLSNLDQSPRKLESQFLSIQLHVQYLKSVDNTDRGRAACLRYLHDWAIYFHPARPDLFSQMQQLAADLGGSLQPPRSSWKYACVESLLGHNLARRSQESLRSFKWWAARSWDKFLFHLEPRTRVNPVSRNSDKPLLQA